MKNITMIEIKSSIGVVDALLDLELAMNRKEALDFVINGAIHIDNALVTNTNAVITYTQGSYSIIKRGRGKYALIVHI